MITKEDIKTDDVIYAATSSIYGKTCFKIKITAVGRNNFLAIRDGDGAEVCLDIKSLKYYSKNDNRKITQNKKIQ